MTPAGANAKPLRDVVESSDEDISLPLTLALAAPTAVSSAHDLPMWSERKVAAAHHSRIDSDVPEFRQMLSHQQADTPGFRFTTSCPKRGPEHTLHLPYARP